MHEFRFPLLWIAIGWVGIVILIWLSLVPLSLKMPVESGDKLGHLIAYGLLMGWFAQLSPRWKTRLFYAAGLILLGISLEFLQQYTGRSFEYADMAADALGVVIALILSRPPLGHLLLKLEQRLSL